MKTKIGRALLGPFVLGSTNMLAWSRRLAPLFALQKRLPVVIDLFVPEAECDDFHRWYSDRIGHYPMWIVPYRTPAPYPWLAERFRGATRYLDFAIYGLPNDEPGVDYSEMLERRVHEHGGIKTLISENHYDEARFWQVYDRARYETMKRRMDPRGVFRDVFDKMVRARNASIPTRKHEPIASTGEFYSTLSSARIGGRMRAHENPDHRFDDFLERRDRLRR